jgi:cold shock CspA family protein
MITSSVSTMASGGSVENQAERQTGKDLVRPPSVPASSLSDSDGDHASRLESSSGGGSYRGDNAGAARATTDKARVSGRVKWFNHHKGFGFITVDNEEEEVFVHQSNIKSDGFRSLWDEELVEFDLVIGEDGKKKAFNVTGPGGQPPQCAMQMGGYRMSPKMHAGMPGMMMGLSGPNPNTMGSMSPAGSAPLGDGSGAEPGQPGQPGQPGATRAAKLRSDARHSVLSATVVLPDQ